MLLCGQVREFHHDGRTNGKHLVNVRLLFDEFLYADGYYAFLAVAAVIGHDNHLVG